MHQACNVFFSNKDWEDYNFLCNCGPSARLQAPKPCLLFSLRRKQPLNDSPPATEDRSWLYSCLTMASSPVKEFLVTYLMPEKCYEEIFVNFHLHGEATRWNFGVNGWNVATDLSRCAGHGGGEVEDVFASPSTNATLKTYLVTSNWDLMWATGAVIVVTFIKKITFWVHKRALVVYLLKSVF